MYGLLGWVGMFVGSWVFWWLGSFISFPVALLLSVVGAGVGMGAGRLLARRFF